MSYIQAIYENGVLRPLAPLDLDENTVVEIDVRDVEERSDRARSNAKKIRAFKEWMESLNPDLPSLADEQISRESMYEEQTRRQL